MKLIPRPRLNAEKGVPYSSEHLRRLEAAGKFPKRVKMNPSDPRGFCGYIESEVDAWIQARAAERDQLFHHIKRSAAAMKSGKLSPA